MKIKNLLYIASAVFVLQLTSSCEDNFLEKQPQSDITPDNFLRQEADLAAYTIDRYGVFDLGANPYIEDNATDVMTNRGYDEKYVPGEWRVGQSGGDWDFGEIFQCNYFLEKVLPRYNSGELSGNQDNIEHYIGEMYMLRAYNYFEKLQRLGDFPIIKTTLPDKADVLIEASKRDPHTEVARFIIADLDSAIMLMNDVSPDGNKNRLNKLSAQLFKSRVALYEGTWLKYFKGTAFVPNGPNWPGAEKDYNANYEFPSGSIDGEIDYFLTQAMEASKQVADNIGLTPNNMVIRQELSDPVNPYFSMFSAVDMSGYDEILFWRQYDLTLEITNNTANLSLIHI